ncbi:MAG: alpha-galactosidase [Microthrixaceae bacterium]
MSTTTTDSTEALGVGQPIRVDAGGWGLTWAVDGVGVLRQIGLGPEGHLATADLPLGLYPEAYPVAGGADPFRPPALAITHADGTLTTRPVARSETRSDEPGGTHVVVSCRDELCALRVEHHLRTHPDSGVLEQWVEVEHDEPGPVLLTGYDSMAPLMLAASDAQACQFGGSGWADEWRWTSETLTPGTKSFASLGGAQPHLQRSPVLLVSPSGPSSEAHGTTLGLSIQWGGNTRFDLDVRPRADPNAPSELRLRAGANPLGAPYLLEAGKRFATPAVAWTWAESRAEVTRRFHGWTRARVLRDPDRLRPIVANNWEATFFDFDEARIVELIGRAADLDADVFLLDDGWFGTTHPRNDDTAGLGDWQVNRAKLPNGLAPLAEAATARGIRFGIWVEPEMVNPASELYERHPGWVVRDRREPREHRNQLMLDPLLPAVRRFEANAVGAAIGAAPGTSYVKWDANRPVTDPGSAALGADRQANVWVDQVHATWAVMDEVVRRHPEAELMLCASGGGRTDHGTLRRFHEFWTSDNTDPVTRVRMQWACSHFFPAAAMAAHVTRWGERPMGFACAVALAGRFGFDLDLEGLSAEEWEVCRAAVGIARRTQPLVQQGHLVRLVSPVEGEDRSRAALAYVADDNERAVLFAYQLEEPVGQAPRLALPDLALPDLAGPAGWTGTVTDLGAGAESQVREYSGEALAAGVDWPLESALTARIWELAPAPAAGRRPGGQATG